MKKGLFGKFILSKADGSDIAPTANYFVLRLDDDRHARFAAEKYAESIQYENPALAEALQALVSYYDLKCKP